MIANPMTCPESDLHRDDVGWLGWSGDPNQPQHWAIFTDDFAYLKDIPTDKRRAITAETADRLCAEAEQRLQQQGLANDR